VILDDVDLADDESVRLFVAGWLYGALLAGDGPVRVRAEQHAVGDRLLPSFGARVGRTQVVVHVDLAIDR
jgi:hypothetical protein